MSDATSESTPDQSYLIVCRLDQTSVETPDGTNLLHDLPAFGHGLVGNQAQVFQLDGSLVISIKGRMVPMSVLASGEHTFPQPHLGLVPPQNSYDPTDPAYRVPSQVANPRFFSEDHVQAMMDDASYRTALAATALRSQSLPTWNAAALDVQIKRAIWTRSPLAFISAWSNKVLAIGDYRSQRSITSYRDNLQPMTQPSVISPFPSWVQVLTDKVTFAHSPLFVFRMSSVIALKNGVINGDVREADCQLTYLEGDPDGKRWLPRALATEFMSSLQESTEYWNARGGDNKDLTYEVTTGSMLHGRTTLVQYAIDNFGRTLYLYIPTGVDKAPFELAGTYLIQGYYEAFGDHDPSYDPAQRSAEPLGAVQVVNTDVDPAWIFEKILSHDSPDDEARIGRWLQSFTFPDGECPSVQFIAATMLQRVTEELEPVQKMMQDMVRTVAKEQLELDAKWHGGQ